MQYSRVHTNFAVDLREKAINHNNNNTFMT